MSTSERIIIEKKEPKVSLTVTVSYSVKNKLEQVAEYTGQTVSSVVDLLLLKALEKIQIPKEEKEIY